MRTAEDYLAQMKALLPQGAAWPREGQEVLDGLLLALAEEFARVDSRADQLMIEADPRTVDEMLGDWERAHGLPDGCVVAEPTIPGRRLALHQRVATLGGLSEPYFIGLAALLGYDTEVEEFDLSRVAFPLPRRINGRPWAYAWRLAIYGPTEIGGDGLYASADLECVIRRLKPAHTIVSFDWSPDPEAAFHFDFTDPD